MRVRDWFRFALAAAPEVGEHATGRRWGVRSVLAVPYLAWLAGEGPHSHRHASGAHTVLRRRTGRQRLGSWSHAAVFGSLTAAPVIAMLLLGLVVGLAGDAALGDRLAALAPWGFAVAPVVHVASLLATLSLSPAARTPLPPSDWVVLTAVGPAERDAARATADAVAVLVDAGESVVARLTDDADLAEWERLGFERVDGDAVDLRLVRSAELPRR